MGLFVGLLMERARNDGEAVTECSTRITAAIATTPLDGHPRSGGISNYGAGRIDSDLALPYHNAVTISAP